MATKRSRSAKTFGRLLRWQTKSPYRLTKAIFETLESRTLLSTYTVTNTSDSGTGSLRQAITDANTAGGTNTVDLTGVSGTIALASVLPNLSSNVTIDGPGAGLLAVNGNGHGSVFSINSGVTVEIDNLTITGGHQYYGGGIYNYGTLAINNCAINNNSAVLGGAGIASFAGTVTVTDCNISDNSASSSAGGGIASQSDTLNVINSTINANSASSSGGGIYCQSDTANIIDSTIYGNSAGVHGGGIYGTSLSSMALNGAIVAGNTNGDLYGAFSGTYNLVGNGTSLTGISNGTSGNQVGTSGSPIDPDLSALGYYGGPTETFALLSGSPAIGAGSGFSFNSSSITIDQRGFARSNSSSSDIGAFQDPPSPWIVNTTLDDPVGPGQLSLRDAINLANPGGGTISFTSGLTGTISVYSSLPSLSGDITIDGPGATTLSVNGEGHGSVFTIDSGVTAEIDGLSIVGGASTTNGGGILNLGTLTVDDSTISGNSTSLSGGGISNSHTLTLEHSTLYDNSAAHEGGGIFNNTSDTITITDCTFNENHSTQSGGAIYNSNSGTVSISDLTAITDNSAGVSGGGISNNRSATVTISDSTISGNSATTGSGGGIYSYYGSIFISDSTVSGNTAPNGGGIYCYGTLTVTDCTVTGNSAGFGGGIENEGSAATIEGTIVANTTAGGDLAGAFDGSDNLIDDASGSWSSSSHNNFLSGSETVNTGSEYTLELPGLTTAASWTLDWGDGSDSGTGSPPSTLNHTFNTKGNYVISGTVTYDSQTFSMNSIPVSAGFGLWIPVTTPPGTVWTSMHVMSNGNVIAESTDGTDWFQLTPNSSVSDGSVSGSYADGSWTTLPGTMHDYRGGFASQILPNGDIFVAGGEAGYPADNEAEVYILATQTWEQFPLPDSISGGNPALPGISDAPSMLLPDGRVLVGAVGSRGLLFDPSAISGFDPTHPDINSPWSLPTPYSTSQDEASWVLLPDGSIVTIDSGGQSAERYFPPDSANPGGQWLSAGNLGDGSLPVQLYSSDDEIGPGVNLADGSAMFLGATGHTAIYTPSTSSPTDGTWTQGPDLPLDPSGIQLVSGDNSATVLPNGDVFAALHPAPAGEPIDYNSTYFVEYSPTTNQFTLLPGLPDGNSNSQSHLMLALPDGGVLVFGTGNDVWEFEPAVAGPGNSSWQPAITNIQQTSDTTFELTGTQLNGISQGAYYGDDTQVATNYPIVRLTSSDGNHVYYATSSNWSSTGLSTGSTPETVNFALPSGLPAGVYSLSVVANGIASNPAAFVYETGSNQAYKVNLSSGGSQFQILVNNSPDYSAPTSSISYLSVNFTGTDDTLAVDATNGNPIPSGGMNVVGGTSTGLSLVGSSGTDTFVVNSAEIGFDSTTINFSNIANISIDPAAGTDSLTVNAGSVTLPAQTAGAGILVRQLSNLAIGATATVVVSTSASHSDRTLIVTGSLSITSGGTLDLGGNDMIIKGAASSLSNIDSLLEEGFSSGTNGWAGDGIASDVAAANSTKNTGLGSMINVGAGGVAFYTSFDGQTVGNTDVLIKYTYYGDADLNGVVNGSDVTVSDNNFNTFGIGWSAGDYNYDGLFNGSDVTLSDNGFNTQGSPL